LAPKKTITANNINVTGDLIAGDQYNYYYYTGDFASLTEYYISPEPVFQRVRTDDFIGRDWLTTKVDAFLNDPNRKSGAFLLIGDAGVGKTSFMAHLVKERKYLHLFAEQTPGQAMLQRAMQSLGSQLVTRYQINPYKDHDTLNALSASPDFLERILRLAASTLTEGEKIVIVCDALDEAGTFPDHFVFGLPKELPDGVYFILSQRPVNVKLPNFEPVIEKLEAQGDGNLQDIEAYLSTVAKRPEVAGQIPSKEYSEDFFIQTLKEKSQGVWMYLHYIIKEIESGARAPLDLANLPTGLVGYYTEYWDAWRTGKRGKGEEAWDELYAPLLTTLAAAQEAITIRSLIQWAGVTATPQTVSRLLSEHWRAFITEKEVSRQKAYAPYHLSFKDFITGRVDTRKLPFAQANLVKDLASQTVDAHKRIVNAFEKECNGEWEKLVEHDYPRLHLTTHLNGAGEYEKLRILLTEGDEKIKWAEAREQKEETYAGYLNDLNYIWENAEREQNYALVIRCMLIENSIHALVSNISPDLIFRLAKSGVWSITNCLTIIRQKTNVSQRLEALALLAPLLPLSLWTEVNSIVVESKNTFIGNISSLEILFLHLPKEFSLEILHALASIESEYWKAELISELTPFLISEHKIALLDLINKLQDNLLVSKCRIAISKYGTPAEKEQTAKDILRIIDDKEYSDLLLEVQIELLSISDGMLQKEILRKVTTVIPSLGLSSSEHYHETLILKMPTLLLRDYFENDKKSIRKLCQGSDKSTAGEILIRLSDIYRPDIREFFDLAKKLDGDHIKLRVLVEIAIRSESSQRIGLLLEIKSEAKKVRDILLRIEILHKILSLSNDLQLESTKEDLLKDGYSILDYATRMQAFIFMFGYMSDEEKLAALNYALTEDEIGDIYSSTIALAKFGDLLEPNQKPKILLRALSLTRIISDKSNSISNVVSFANFLGKQNLQYLLESIESDLETYEKASAIVSIFPFLDIAYKQKALDLILKFQNLQIRVDSLLDITPLLEEEIKTTVHNDIFSIISKFDKPQVSIDTIKKCLLVFSKELRILLIDSLISNNSKNIFLEPQQNIAVEVFRFATKPQKEKILEIFSSINQKGTRNHFLIQVPGLVDKELRDEIYSDVLEDKSIYESLLADRITDLYNSLGSAMQGKMISELYKLQKEILLIKLLPYLKDEERKEIALNIWHKTLKDHDDFWFSEELAELSNYLPEEKIDFAQSEAISLALRAPEEILRIRLLIEQVPYLRKEFRTQAIDEALLLISKMDFSSERIYGFFYNLAPYLTSEKQSQALKIILGIKNKSIQAPLLESIIEHLDHDLKISALQELMFFRNYNWTKLWQNVDYEGMEEKLPTYFRFVANSERAYGVESVSLIMPALVHFRGPEIADEIYRTITDVTRWWP
jgi:hypothetical protein